MSEPRSLSAHVLIIDDERGFRDVVVAQFAQAGAKAVAAESYEAGLQVFARDPEIKLVILDHPTVGCRVEGIVNSLRDLRPDVTIVGNSGGHRQAEFATAGVDKYLQKPWRLPELLALIAPRIEYCIDCQRPLPLRLPLPGEIADRWICASCGARYRAVLVEGADEEQRRYVLRADAIEPGS